MIRSKLRAAGCTSECEIHYGPYNNVKNWDDAGLIEVFNASETGGPRVRETNGRELAAAVEATVANREGPTLIGRVIERDDC